MKLKAYVVSEDDEGHCCIRFAHHAIVARREGAHELDQEFESVECRRSPEFDSFVPGPVPPLVLLDFGWWFECCGCTITITSDCEDEDGNKLEPVGDNYWSFYCSPGCQQRDLYEREEIKRRQIVAIAAMVNEACRRWRGILLEGRPHAYVSHLSDIEYSWWTEEQVIIYFSFPGSKHGLAQYRREKNGVCDLLVPSGDIAAWNAWRDEELVRKKMIDIDLSDLSHSYPFLDFSRRLGISYGEVLKIVHHMDNQIREATCGITEEGLVKWSNGLIPELRLLIARICQAPWRWQFPPTGRGL